MLIGVCLHWVDLAPTIDAGTGEVRTDARTSGLTPADAAALEWALRAGEVWGADVHAVTAGPPPADAVLRIALAAGAGRATHVDVAAGFDDASSVAAALAPVLAGADLVLCGDQGAIAGSGAVPALLAHHLGAAPALGVVHLELGAERAGALRATRRLDGGRRELLAVTTPAVVSVEGATAHLRRASLPATLAAATATIDRRAGITPAVPLGVASRRGPLRPRSHELPAPVGRDALERVRLLVGAADGASPTSRRAPVELGPDAAAQHILDALRSWGYPLPTDDDDAG